MTSVSLLTTTQGIFLLESQEGEVEEWRGALRVNWLRAKLSHFLFNSGDVMEIELSSTVRHSGSFLSQIIAGFKMTRD